MHGERGTAGAEADGGNGLVERIQKINLRSVGTSGIGVGNRSGTGNWIDGDALRSLREADADVWTSEEREAVGVNRTGIVLWGVQGIGETGAAQNVQHRKHAVEVGAVCTVFDALDQNRAGIAGIQGEGLAGRNGHVDSDQA